jgi:hypothetical protein
LKVNYFLSIERVFAGTEEGSLFARCSLIGQPADLGKGLSRYGSLQADGASIVLPVPPRQAKLAAAGVLGFAHVITDGNLISRIRFVDSPHGHSRGATKQEQGMEFTKMQHDPNSTRPAHRPAVDLSNTLVIDKGVRHAVRVGDQGKDDALNAALQKFLEARKGGSTTSDTDTRLEKLRLDMKNLEEWGRAEIEKLSKRVASPEVLDQGLDQGSGTEIASGPTSTLLDDLGVGRKLNPPITVNFESMSTQQAIEFAGELSKMANDGLSEEQVRSMKSQGRSPFAEAFIADRVSGASRRSFTYRR